MQVHTYVLTFSLVKNVFHVRATLSTTTRSYVLKGLFKTCARTRDPEVIVYSTATKPFTNLANFSKQINFDT